MSDIYNTWKGINTALPINKDPMIGMVYTAKFHNLQVVGVLESIGHIEASIKTRDGKILSVNKQTLKILLNK